MTMDLFESLADGMYVIPRGDIIKIVSGKRYYFGVAIGENGWDGWGPYNWMRDPVSEPRLVTEYLDPMDFASWDGRGVIFGTPAARKVQRLRQIAGAAGRLLRENSNHYGPYGGKECREKCTKAIKALKRVNQKIDEIFMKKIVSIFRH